ncbi:MAG TPA: DUF302 domain-containing protein [Flavobacteriaceae bacterium]|nr:DUF302 domain-containing protein [Flavobacteriaceae bacterium]
MRFLISVLMVALFVSCSSDDRTITYPDTPGLAYAESEATFTETYRGLRASMQQADYRIEEIDFKEYAESHGKRSREAKMILFSNPSLEVPLLKENPKIGMEFPSRVLTFEDRDKFILVAYNNMEYYSRMYDLNNMGAVQNMESSLSQIVSDVTGNMTMKNETAMVGKNTITIASRKSFNETYNTLRNIISDNPEMNLLAEVDHQLNASTVGEDIRPNKLLLFTTGLLEANLIDRHQLSVMDLPLRLLVWEDENNKVHVSYSDLYTIKDRHQMEEVDKLSEIRVLLADLVLSASN